MAFTAETGRTQRRSDGTISLKGIRFEIPSRYHHFQRLSVRAAFWDLSQVHLVDPKTGAILCRLFPLDKRKNAQGERAAKGSALDRPAAAVSPAPSSMAPLLQKLIQQYAITGLPPAYLPKQQSNTALMNKKLLSLYSLKFNPFSPEVPTSALWSAPIDRELLLAHRTANRRRRLRPGDRRSRHR